MTSVGCIFLQALEGNSLAVFSDARGLSDTEMQAIAKEMNLSETTFIFPRDPKIERERGVRVRIFTVQEDCPSPGTLRWARLSLARRQRAQEITLELNVGKVPVRFEDSPTATFVWRDDAGRSRVRRYARTGSGCACDGTQTWMISIRRCRSRRCRRDFRLPSRR